MLLSLVALGSREAIPRRIQRTAVCGGVGSRCGNSYLVPKAQRSGCASTTQLITVHTSRYLRQTCGGSMDGPRSMAYAEYE